MNLTQEENMTLDLMITNINDDLKEALVTDGRESDAEVLQERYSLLRKLRKLAAAAPVAAPAQTGQVYESGCYTPRGQPAPVAAPDGWKRVPVEPTGEMLAASHKLPIAGTFNYEIYQAMVAAAPVAAQTERTQEPAAWYRKTDVTEWSENEPLFSGSWTPLYAAPVAK